LAETQYPRSEIAVKTSPVGQDQQTRKAAEPPVGRRYSQATAILESSHARDGGIERMQRDRPCLKDDGFRLSTGDREETPTMTASMAAATVKRKQRPSSTRDVIRAT
jgi:hypothetical protein